jgi:mannose/fructose/N-acetylgalactosamine-specific phosphotransferase system component IID
MENLVTKISSYDIINNLVPGGLTLCVFELLGFYSFDDMNVIILLFCCYVMGVIDSRVGSLVLEPIARRAGFLEWRDYSRYLDAEKRDKRIKGLQSIANMYRSLAGCFLVILVIWVVRRLFVANTVVISIALILSFVLFLLSWRKQNLYIVGRIDKWTEHSDNRREAKEHK